MLNLNSKVKKNSGITGDNKYLTIQKNSISPGRQSSKSSLRKSKMRFGSFDDMDMGDIPCEEKQTDVDSPGLRMPPHVSSRVSQVSATHSGIYETQMKK